MKALLIRLILALSGCAPKQCCEFLIGEDSNPFLIPRIKVLRKLFVHHANSLAPGDIAIGVDELMELGVDMAKLVVSELAEVAALYLSETSSMCTVLVSSLVTKIFVTYSGRPVVDWSPNRPGLDALEYFCRSLTKEKKEQAMALVNTVSGGHIRSMVIACDLFIGCLVPVSVKFLFEEMKERMGSKLSNDTLKGIVQHVNACIKSAGTPVIAPDVELVADTVGAVPPVFLMLAFENRNEAGSLLNLENLLNAFSLFDGAGKHLKLVAKHYDLFRASLSLPVVPGNVTVFVPRGNNLHKLDQWYKELKFHNAMSENKAALLKQTNVLVEGKRTNVTVSTGELPEFGCYYHPSICNHPWVDRVYVAKHPDETLCLVLVQDKVNAVNFLEACDKLNKAADCLTTFPNLKHALLIVNVIGASEQTRAQSTLRWPHILIRGKNEVRAFYSVNFADMVWFARERHRLSL